MSDLPDRAYMTPLLNRIADVAGERAALILGREKACERIYIPNVVTADHWLSVLVGIEPAQAICDAFGGDKLEIPPAMAGDKRRRAATIAQMIEKGYSNNAIARALGITHKTVQRHRGKTDDGQGSLF
ncbi:regulatory LuxR family protein [Rhizobium sp. SJZ105]|uniref:LuxR C-terminal-related transcriptional regulator n=1 Tax=Rhizobium sp. SJZ105 TaxID=2572678 RepID=UPI00119F8FBB|nr:LuxR C-terminal-related transcriptional regulator [Rhizobium sp. SJZ105]TWC85637.1 regulatory LuxR family protein [Rhizobium sp. SJZ105]